MKCFSFFNSSSSLLSNIVEYLCFDSNVNVLATYLVRFIVFMIISSVPIMLCCVCLVMLRGGEGYAGVRLILKSIATCTTTGLQVSLIHYFLVFGASFITWPFEKLNYGWWDWDLVKVCSVDLSLPVCQSINLLFSNQCSVEKQWRLTCLVTQNKLTSILLLGLSSIRI